jgi:molybdate transport system substrate-binding protein
MKKVLTLFLALCMLISLGACGSANSKATEPAAAGSPAAENPAANSPEASPGAEPVELFVFAAASMTETLTEIIELYKSEVPFVTVTPTFDSSGTLKTQIEEGAECDIFLSAAQKQMNQMDLAAGSEKNPDGLDFVLSDTRVNLLENKVVLVVPEGNPAGIESFDDLKNADLIALGNSDVPVGSYSLEILEFLGLDAAELENAGKITYGSNVKDVTTQVSEGTVDCGIVYATDAFSAGLQVADTAAKDMCSQIIYPVAVMKSCENVEAAQAFLDFLKTEACAAVFEKVGFAMAG